MKVEVLFYSTFFFDRHVVVGRPMFLLQAIQKGKNNHFKNGKLYTMHSKFSNCFVWVSTCTSDLKFHLLS